MGTGCWVELCSVLYLRMDVDEFAYLLADGLVEIDEELIVAFIERTDIIGCSYGCKVYCGNSCQQRVPHKCD